MATGVGPEVDSLQRYSFGVARSRAAAHRPCRVWGSIDLQGSGSWGSCTAATLRSCAYLASRKPPLALRAVRARFTWGPCRRDSSWLFTIAAHCAVGTLRCGLHASRRGFSRRLANLGRTRPGSACSRVCTCARCPGSLPGLLWTSPARGRGGNLRFHPCRTSRFHRPRGLVASFLGLSSIPYLPRWPPRCRCRPALRPVPPPRCRCRPARAR